MNSLGSLTFKIGIYAFTFVNECNFKSIDFQIWTDSKVEHFASQTAFEMLTQLEI